MRALQSRWLHIFLELRDLVGMGTGMARARGLDMTNSIGMEHRNTLHLHLRVHLRQEKGRRLNSRRKSSRAD